MEVAAPKPKQAPEPEGNWLLGRLRDFLADPLKFMLELSGHGPVVRFRLLFGINYLISDIDLVDEVLVRRSDEFPKNRGFWARHEDIFGQGLLTAEGDTWRQHRKMAAPAFHHQRLAHYVNYMAQYGERMLNGWKPGEVRDVHDDMMQVTAEIVTRALFNAEFQGKHSPLRKAIDEIRKQFASRLHRPLRFFDKLPFPDNIRFRKALKVTETHIAQIIADHRRNQDNQHSLLTMLMQSCHNDGTPLSDKQLRDEAITLLLAGHDTTAITLSWTFYQLSRHPQYWAKLRQEWYTVLVGSVPTAEDMMKLPLTRGVIKETLRLYPPAYLFGRMPAEDTTLGGYLLPKGVGVVISPYVMGLNEKYFPKPHEFMPERWTQEFEKTLPRHAFMPFGGGPRTCIGEGFAMLEAMVLLLLIGRRFTLQYADSKPAVPLVSANIPPKGGMKMRCLPV